MGTIMKSRFASVNAVPKQIHASCLPKELLKSRAFAVFQWTFRGFALQSADAMVISPHTDLRFEPFSRRGSYLCLRRFDETTRPDEGRRGLYLSTSPPAYRCIITQRLDEIRKHGDPQRYGSFFPNYLLKTLQQWFLHNGDDLYDQLNQIRNALFSAEAIIARLRTPHACDTYQQEQIWAVTPTTSIWRKVRRQFGR